MAPRASHASFLVIGLVTLHSGVAAAQTPAWCITTAGANRVFQGCGIAASREESVRQAYGELARLLEARVQVNARTTQGANVVGASTQLGRDREGHAQRNTRYDSTTYEVRLQSDVAMHGLSQRQATVRGRVYTLVTYDARPQLEQLDTRLLEANAALMRGDLAAGVAECRRAAAMMDSVPWIAGLSASEPDCAHIADLLDSHVRITLLDADAARVTFDETPIADVFLVARRGANGVLVRGIGPSSSAGIVDLPPAAMFGDASFARELFDVEWDRTGVTESIPFHARASRALKAGGIALSVTTSPGDDPMLRRVAGMELAAQLHVAVGDSTPAPISPSGKAWKLVVSGTVRDLGPSFGGERISSASIQWTVVDARSGRQIGGGAVVDQRGSAGDQAGAREAAVRLAIRRVVSELERLAGAD